MINILGIAHNEVNSIDNIYEALEKYDPNCLVLEFSENDLKSKERLKLYNISFLNNIRIEKENSKFKSYYNNTINIISKIILLLIYPVLIFYVNIKISSFFQKQDINNFKTTKINEVLVGLEYSRSNNIDVYGVDLGIENMETIYLNNNNFCSLLYNTPINVLKKYCLTGSSSRYFHLSEDVNDKREKNIIKNLERLNDEYDNILCILGEEHIDNVNESLNNKDIDSKIRWRRFGEEKLENKPWFLKL